MVEIGYLAQRAKISAREDAGAAARRRHGFAARRRRGNFQRSRAAHHLRSQDRPASSGSRRRAHRASAWAAFQLHHAVRPHRDRRGSRRSPGASCASLQDETDGFVTFIPLAFHPDNTALRAHSQDHRLRGYQEDRGGAPDARQHPAHQGLLDHDDAADRADRAALRRRRYRRHGGGGEDLPRRRRHHQSRICGAASCCA